MKARPEVREKKIECCMSKILKELMKRESITQIALAERLGVAHGRVKSWLERKAPIASWELFRCCEFFKVPVTYMLYGIWEEGYEKSKPYFLDEYNSSSNVLEIVR